MSGSPRHIDAVWGWPHHVWVAPVLAGYRLGRHDTIECVHVSGLFARRAASWPVWDPRAVVKTSKRARSSPCDTDFPNPDLVDRFHTRFSFSRILEALPRTPSGRRKRSPSKLLIFRYHGPQHARHLVRQSDSGQHPWLAGEDAPEPGGLRRWSNLGAGNNRHRANDHQAPDIPLPGFARPPEPWFATARMLSGHKTQPGREVARPPESLHRRSESRQSH